MAGGSSWRTYRIFISGMFCDMHAERDHLVRIVFPEPKERWRAHRVTLVDVDLRWGEITAETGGRIQGTVDDESLPGRGGS